MGWVFIVSGAFAFLAAVLNWEWFMNHRKVRFFVRLFGRTGARIFYGVIGLVLVLLGLLLVTGVIQES